jgi:hypothetical protein
MTKMTFDEALDRINDGASLDASDIQASALRRVVWVAEWHVPGCLSESHSICLTRADAIREALTMCDNARGAATDLRRHGRTDRVSDTAYVSMAVTTVSRSTLADLI